MELFSVIGVIIAVCAALLICYLAWRFFLEYRYAEYSGKKAAHRKKKTAKEKTPCPLCGSKLYAGENLISRVYNTGTPADLPCSVHGCPYCYPELTSGLRRICPVCHKEVPLEGHLDARLFTRKTGKKHVHITGCTECHKKT